MSKEISRALYRQLSKCDACNQTIKQHCSIPSHTDNPCCTDNECSIRQLQSSEAEHFDGFEDKDLVFVNR